MFPMLDELARRLVRRGLRRGLMEGETLWLVVAAAAWLARLALRPERARIIRQRLRLGETITVTNVEPGRRGARNF
jgi:hypothetical protein